MPIKVTCSQCGGVLHAPDDSSGKRGRCPTCGTVLTIIGEFVGPTPSQQFGAPATQRPPAAPVSNPWGSLPGGPDDAAPGMPPSGPVPAPAPRPTYELAKDPPAPRPGLFPAPSEPIPSSRGSRVPPDPRKVSVQDPFAKPGKPNDEVAESNAKWAKAYRGLGWVRTGIALGFIGVLAYAVLPILPVFNVPLPSQTPGVLKIADYSQAHELRLAATLGPLLLGLLCIALGRLGLTAVPVSSGARGLAMFSSLATLVAVGGLVAVAVITGLAMKDGGFIPQLTPSLSKAAASPTLVEKVSVWADGVFLTGRERTGQIQGFGAAAFLVFGLLAEVAFVGVLGRIAATHRHASAAGRVNRFIILMGLLFAAKVALLLAARVYYLDWFDTQVWSKWDGLDDKAKTIVPHAAVALGGLLLAVLYWRMIGGVKAAIRDNVDVSV